MIYRFKDNQGTFLVDNPQRFDLYLGLTNKEGSLLSSISPNLAGDIKKDNDRFLTPPASIADLKNNLLCRRDFFLKTPKQIIRLSVRSNDILEIGILYHKVIKDIAGLRIEILNFIPYDMGVEVMRVRVANKSAEAVKFSPFSFLPLYGRSEKNIRDHRHVTSLLNRIKLDKYGIYLKPTMVFDEGGHSLNKSAYYVLGYEGNFRPPIGQFPTLEYFCREGGLMLPDAVRGDVLPLRHKLPEFDGKEACAAFRFPDKRLRPRESTDYVLIMGIEEGATRIKNNLRRLNSPRKIENAFQATKKYWQDYLSKIEFDFQDKDFNNWLLWVKLQPRLRKLFGCSFLPHFDYGKGGRGWRDIWQDGLALLLSEPGQAKAFLRNNFKGVRIDGSNATIITKEGGFISDRNRISRVWMDHGIWPYLTCRLYLDKTADLNFLRQEVGYFRDAQLRRAREIDLNFSGKDNFLRDKNNKIYKGTILEHIILQHLVQFFNVGKHNVIRLENADWNDGLDMAPERGESVAFSFMYARNLYELSILLRMLKIKKTRIFQELLLLLDRMGKPINYANYKEKQKRLEEYFFKVRNLSGKKSEISIEGLIDDLSQKAAHLTNWLRRNEWQDAGFFNGYYDNQSRRVEGRFPGGVRLMLASQALAILSGVADNFQIKKIWQALRKYLQDKESGGFRLNTDFKKPDPDLGRCFGFSYGDKENGAFFNHMAVILVNGLYQRGFTREGFTVMDSIYRMAVSEKSGIYPMIPEYFNRQGRGLYFYLTGSASWYIHTLMEEVLGIKFNLGDINLETKLLPQNFFGSKIKVKFNLGKKSVKIVFIKTKDKNRALQIKGLFLGNRRLLPLAGRYIIPRRLLTRPENNITVFLK